MKLINLGEQSSVLNSFVAQLRDKNIQKDSLRFRTNLERLGQIFAYEISKTLNSVEKQVTTPLGIATLKVPDEQIVVATILRAGLPLHEGVLSCFDNAENAFVAAYRKYDNEGEFHIHTEYCTCPELGGKTLILADTMLATGSSVQVAYEVLCQQGGVPGKLHLVCPFASAQAVENLKKSLPEEAVLWVAAVDPELTSHSYIVPGLGDAGDLCYGGKL
ncbi:MAG: uracil phosphoribosyltransferase [Candidatus Cryptobacteroides sp.]